MVRVWPTLPALPALPALIVALLVGEGAAQAFDPDGHEVVEALGYRDLIARDHVADTKVSGAQIIAYLIRRGFLARPRCFDVKPGDLACPDQARREDPVDFWPILGTGSQDLLLSRQFGSRGQCFHFMADTRDADSPRGPSVVAYQRCLRLATSLFDEILRDPYVASIRGRGTYVLMHMMADSFSRAHVERGPDLHIHHLKVWTLRNDFLFDIHKFEPRFQHALIDRRDKGFIDDDRVVDGKPCGKVVAPYELRPACLSPDGKAAVETLTDFLVTLYVVAHHAGGAAEGAGGLAPPVNLEHEQGKTHPMNPTSLDEPFARDHWQALLERHFVSDSAPVLLDKQHDDERGWEPNLLVAGVYRQDTSGNGWDAGARLAWLQVVRQALPLIPLESATLGYGSFGDEGRWLARVEMSFLMPIWDRLGIGFSPVSFGFSCASDFSSCRGDALTLPARLSYFSDLGFWVDVTGPEYSWVDRVWSYRMGLTVGAAFDVFDNRRPLKILGHGPSPVEAEAPWSPPPMPELLRYRTPASVTIFVEGAIANSAGDHQLSTGIEVRKERDADNRRAGLGYGLELAYQTGKLDDRPLDEARIVPALRYYLLTGFLSLRLTPLALAIGKWGDDFYLDAGADAEVCFSVGGFEVGVGGPRLSYAHWDQNHGTPLNLRFAWRWWD